MKLNLIINNSAKNVEITKYSEIPNSPTHLLKACKEMQFSKENISFLSFNLKDRVLDLKKADEIILECKENSTVNKILSVLATVIMISIVVGFILFVNISTISVPLAICYLIMAFCFANKTFVFKPTGYPDNYAFGVFALFLGPVLPLYWAFFVKNDSLIEKGNKEKTKQVENDLSLMINYYQENYTSLHKTLLQELENTKNSQILSIKKTHESLKKALDELTDMNNYLEKLVGEQTV